MNHHHINQILELIWAAIYFFSLPSVFIIMSFVVGFDDDRWVVREKSESSRQQNEH